MKEMIGKPKMERNIAGLAVVLTIAVIAMTHPVAADLGALRGLVNFSCNDTLVPNDWNVSVENLNETYAGEPWTTTTNDALLPVGANYNRAIEYSSLDNWVRVYVHSPDYVYTGVNSSQLKSLPLVLGARYMNLKVSRAAPAPTTTVTPSVPTTGPEEEKITDWTNTSVMLSFRRIGGTGGVNYTNLSLAQESNTSSLNVVISNDTQSWSTTLAKGVNTTVPFNETFGEYFNVTIDEDCNATIEYYSVDKATPPNNEPAKNLTVRIDMVEPTIDVVSPADGTPDVPVTTDIVAHFDSLSPMNSSMLTTAVIVVNSTEVPVAGAVTYGDATQNVTFDPTVNLAYNETYNVTIMAGVEDLAGNAMVNNYSWEFTTAMEALPELTNIGILPLTATLNINDTQVFTATAYDQNGNPMPGINITWTSYNEGVGTVSPSWNITGSDGTTTTTFTALAEGAAVISAGNATVDWWKWGYAYVGVTAEPSELTNIGISPSTATLNVSDTQVFTATAYDQYDVPMAGINITWMVTNTTVGTVSPSWNITGSDGTTTTTFTALAEGTAMISAGNATIPAWNWGYAYVGVTAEPSELTNIRIVPLTATLNVTDTQVFTATTYDQYGDPMPGINIRWASTNGIVGTVSPSWSRTGYDGTTTTTFTALAGGTAMISAVNTAIPAWKWGYAYVNVTPVAGYGVNLTADTYTDTVAQNKAATYTLTVRNTGTMNDTFNLTIDDPTNASLSKTATILLQPNETDALYLNVSSATLGTYVVNATATSQTDANVSDTKMFTTTVADIIPPANITNLAAGSPTTNSITLTWTAPGDDENTGTAKTYDIRYSASEIIEENWGSATQCTGEPAPEEAGSSETYTVTGLSSGTTYYFAIKTADEVEWSPVSNSPSGTTERRRVGGGGGGGAPKDSDGDGYSDIQEMIAGTDENDPCDPNPECAACLASKPAATPTPTPTVTPTPTIPPVVTTPTPTPTPTPTEEPGFEAVFAIAGLLAVAYLVLRRKRK